VLLRQTDKRQAAAKAVAVLTTVGNLMLEKMRKVLAGWIKLVGGTQFGHP